MGPHRISAIAAVVTLTAATAIGLLTPLVLGAMVDAVTDADGDAVSRIGTLTLALVGIAVASSLLVGMSNYLLAGVGERVVADLREEVVVRVLDLPQSDVERAGRGDLVSRITGDVRLVTRAVSEALPVFATAALTIVLTLIGLGSLDWRFAVAAVIAAPIQIQALRWYLSRSAPVYREEREAEGARAQQLLDSLSNSDTVGSLRLAESHLEQIESRSMTAVRLSLLTTRLRTRFFGRLNIAEFIGLSAVLITGFWLVKDGQISIGAATAAALFFHRLFDPVGAVLSVFDELQEAQSRWLAWSESRLRPCHLHRPIRRNLSTAQLLWNASHSRTEAATLLFCETSTSPFRQEPSPHWWALPEPENLQSQS